MISNDVAMHQNMLASGKVPFFFREKYAGFMVKGNFMTLAARPHLVEEGEWLAHQIVEQARQLNGWLKTMQEVDRHTGLPTCNEEKCPVMSAGANTYMWMDTKGNSINLPAPAYIKNIQTWVNGKIQDQSLFPTDNFVGAPPLPRQHEMMADPNHWLGKTSGFPQRFESEIKNMYKQMFRCYAHLYWHHWLDFNGMSADKELNTAFVHFINVARVFQLLGEKEMEPMAPLIELWVKAGVLPKQVTVDESGKTIGPAGAFPGVDANGAPLA